MLSIPTAAEARKPLTERESDYIKERYNDVAKAIQKAREEDEHTCTIDGTLPGALIRILKENGYTLRPGGLNTSGYFISW